ncbi:MAG: MurR/RpiR family transcriptional regulator, partial [Alphaproteobacteria bacterium]|nr:MurR/RpiR family transcriptional regulator [Alphaproteobacteria bacterium]
RPSYLERIRAFGETSDGDSQVPLAVLDRFVGAAVLALNNLNETVEAEALEHALESLVSASTIYVVGQRRAFPVAAYLGYAFAQLGRRTVLVDSIGGMLPQQASAIRAEDAVVAVSFHPYSPESLQVVEHARDRGAAIVAITDGPTQPVGRPRRRVIRSRGSPGRIVSRLVGQHVPGARACRRPRPPARCRQRHDRLGALIAT